MIRRLLASLHSTLTRGRLEPGQPHPYSPERHWFWVCWCDSPKTAPVHDDRRGLLEAVPRQGGRR
jgi:hypothetical protein